MDRPKSINSEAEAIEAYKDIVKNSEQEKYPAHALAAMSGDETHREYPFCIYDIDYTNKPDLIAEAQKIQRMSQRLSNLALFLSRIAKTRKNEGE